MEQKNILVVIPVEERHKQMLKSAYPNAVFEYKNPSEIQTLKNYHMIIGNVPAKMLKTAEKLEWIQLNSAGADQYVQKGVLKNGTLLTNATGAYGLAISEHLLGETLMLLKRLNQYYANQISHEWKDQGKVGSIWGSRTLVIGLGDIGSEYGKRMKALGSHVVGIKRHTDHKPEWLDELYGMDALDSELKKADIIAMSLPNTPATVRLMDMEKFRLMKKNAILLNVGRGSAIVQEDLCRALNEELIFGAFLDVTDPEPLPPDNPLWSAKNIVITPHISGEYHLQETFERIVRIACENLKRYSENKQLTNLVDFETGYKKHTTENR